MVAAAADDSVAAGASSDSDKEIQQIWGDVHDRDDELVLGRYEAPRTSFVVYCSEVEFET